MGLNLYIIQSASRMAIPHDELSFRSQSPGAISSNPRGLFIMVFSSICGLLSLVLALAAEATRSEATWMVLSDGQQGQTNQCMYNSSGKTPLEWAVGAFLLLAVAMFTGQAYILVALISTARPPVPMAYNLSHGSPAVSSSPSFLTYQACCFFSTTWVSFTIAEVLLMIGIGVESGHLNKWKVPRSNCLVVRPGLFAAAGVFGLITVFLAAGIYMAALRPNMPHPSPPNWRPRIPPPDAPTPHGRLPQSLHATDTNVAS